MKLIKTGQCYKCGKPTKPYSTRCDLCPAHPPNPAKETIKRKSFSASDQRKTYRDLDRLGID